MVLIEKFTTKLQITLPNFSTTAYTSYLSGNIKRFYAASAKPKVYVTRQVNKKAIDILKEKCDVTMWKGSDKAVPRDELLKNIKDKSGLFCLLTDKIDKQLLDNAPKLKVVATMSVGYDHFSVKEIKSRGIKMGYTPFILTDATAELTVALLLATSRRIVEGAHEAKSGGWQTWQPFWLCGPGLSGATVGVFGFGRIGQETAKRLKPFNVKKILFFDPAKKQKEAQSIGATQVNFDELLKNSDFITVNCALTPKTMGIFNDSAFKKMKKNAVFVNTSRGPVVDQKALIKALQEKTIYGAGLDVTVPEPLPLDSPLFKMKNCVILPHIGSATIDTRNAMAELTSKNIVNALEGKKMPAELVV